MRHDAGEDPEASVRGRSRPLARASAGLPVGRDLRAGHEPAQARQPAGLAVAALVKRRRQLEAGRQCRRQRAEQCRRHDRGSRRGREHPPVEREALEKGQAQEAGAPERKDDQPRRPESHHGSAHPDQQALGQMLARDPIGSDNVEPGDG